MFRVGNWLLGNEDSWELVENIPHALVVASIFSITAFGHEFLYVVFEFGDNGKK